MAKFKGFSPGLLEFLVDLKENNNKDFFNANKERYEELVREPALELIRTLEPIIHKKISPHFRLDDSKVGGSLMRIHRDIRFSKDKTPYKTNVGIHIRHEAGKDVHAPGLYIHIGLDGVFLGVGLWHPDAPSLKAIRAQLESNGAAYTRAVEGKKLKEAGFTVRGEALSRPPKGVAKDHPMVEALKLKDHILAADLDAKDIERSDFATYVGGKLATTKPFLTFLCGAIGQPL